MIYRDLQKELLANILVEGFDTGGLKLVLVNSDTWQYALPEPMDAHKQIVLDIKGWALEQSYVDDEGVFIQTAFGDDENSKHFSFDEIINIVTFEGRLLYQKVMSLEEPKPKEPEKLKKGIGTKMSAENIDNEKVQYSMKMMLENNKHLAKKEKK